MVTEIVEPQNDQGSWRTVLWGVLNAAVMVLGLAAVLWGAGTAALSTLYLPRVDESVLGHGVTTLARPIDTTWGVTVALTAFGMVACAGLPSMRDAARSLSGAIGQGFGGVIVAGSSMLVLERSTQPAFPLPGTVAFMSPAGRYVNRRLRWHFPMCSRAC